MVKLHKKNPVKWAPWLDPLVAAMWFEHMTLRVWKIKIENKRHGWRGGCEMIEDGSFVWIKHIYEYSKLTEISTVWKSRIVQNEVYTCEKHLSFNTKKQCAKNALCFFSVWQLLEVSEESVTDSKKFPLPFKDSF